MHLAKDTTVSRTLAAVSAAALALSVVGAAVVGADPPTCPPSCDSIPSSAWPDPAAIPLATTYHWPELAGIARPEQRVRFYFEELCGSQFESSDPRNYAVAAKAKVGMPSGKWQLQVQVLHWRGETWIGGQLADQVLTSATAGLKTCLARGYPESGAITTEGPGRLAAAYRVAGTVPLVVHEYLLTHVQSSTLVELTMWAVEPPADNWPAIPDTQVFEALVAPLCVAYIASCR
jgi:hypothetical protein